MADALRARTFAAVHVERQADHKSRCPIFSAEVGEGAYVFCKFFPAQDGQRRDQARCQLAKGNANALWAVIKPQHAGGVSPLLRHRAPQIFDSGDRHATSCAGFFPHANPNLPSGAEKALP